MVVLGDFRSTVVSALSLVVGAGRAGQIVDEATSFIQAKAKEGAEKAIPTIEAKVKAAVQAEVPGIQVKVRQAVAPIAVFSAAAGLAGLIAGGIAIVMARKRRTS